MRGKKKLNKNEAIRTYIFIVTGNHISKRDLKNDDNSFSSKYAADIFKITEETVKMSCQRVAQIENNKISGIT